MDEPYNGQCMRADNSMTITAIDIYARYMKAFDAYHAFVEAEEPYIARRSEQWCAERKTLLDAVFIWRSVLDRVLDGEDPIIAVMSRE